MAKDNIEIKHDAEQQLFYIDLPIELKNDQPSEDQALIRYRLSVTNGSTASGTDEDKVVVNFYSTFVPDSHRGKGLAALLVEHGFLWAEKNSYQIEASCWYAAKNLDQRTA